MPRAPFAGLETCDTAGLEACATFGIGLVLNTCGAYLDVPCW